MFDAEFASEGRSKVASGAKNVGVRHELIGFVSAGSEAETVAVWIDLNSSQECVVQCVYLFIEFVHRFFPVNQQPAAVNAGLVFHLDRLLIAIDARSKAYLQ